MRFNTFSSRFAVIAAFCACFFLQNSINAQWSLHRQQAFGGSQFEEVTAAANCPDGSGTWLCGNTQSNDFPGRTAAAGSGWVARLNEQQVVQLQVFCGGESAEKSSIQAICPTTDGGFAIAGSTSEEFLEKNLATKFFGKAEFWIAKHDALGNLEWQLTLGSDDNDIAYSIQPTPDGGLVAAGEVFSKTFGGRKSLDILVVKISEFGQIEWQRMLGGMATERGGRGLAVDLQGNIYVAANSQSGDKNIGTDTPHGGSDGYLAKLNPQGKIQWQHLFGGYGEEFLTDLRWTSDRRLVVFGHSDSSDGDLPKNQGGSDFWLFQVSEKGKIEWSQTFGGSKIETAGKIAILEDGRVFASGTTFSNDGDVRSGLHGKLNYSDAWLVSTDKKGKLEWAKTYGGERAESFQTLLAGKDNSLQAFGSMESADLAGLQNRGGGDIWTLELLDAQPRSENRNMVNRLIEVFPNPAIDQLFYSIDCARFNCAVESISFTDGSGRMVFFLENPTSPVYFGHLKSGIYFVHFKIEGRYEKPIRVIVGN